MKSLKWSAIVLSAYLLVLVLGYNLPARVSAFMSEPANGQPSDGVKTEALGNLAPSASALSRYGLDASQSKFIAHAFAGGLLWFKGHDHLVAVREFTGEARLDPDSIASSSLQINAKAGSMIETSSVFTEPQKQIIDKELREIVLEPDKYPEIVFRSTSVTGKAAANNQYDLKLAGDLTLHGVTRPITIPAKVIVTGNDLRAQGEFSIDRGDFKVKATSAFHGLVRVRDKVKFEFDIVGHRL